MSDVLALLQEFYRDKLTTLLRHQEGARFVGQYDFNNTYQYIVNREETQLTWVSAAILELGGSLSDVSPVSRTPNTKGADATRRIIEEDAHEAQAFVDRWKPRVDAMTNARHAKMLRVVLGETMEQKRFFEQALAGRTDLLGRRSDTISPAKGEVLATRWVE